MADKKPDRPERKSGKGDSAGTSSMLREIRRQVEAVKENQAAIERLFAVLRNSFTAAIVQSQDALQGRLDGLTSEIEAMKERAGKRT